MHNNLTRWKVFTAKFYGVADGGREGGEKRKEKEKREECMQRRYKRSYLHFPKSTGSSSSGELAQVRAALLRLETASSSRGLT